MIKKINRCMGCMNEKEYSGPCKICGYIDNNSYPADCLAPGTFLSDRYVIGKLISKNGEGCAYLAFDTKEERTVEIREFLPDALCSRNEDGITVDVKEGSLPLFKSYLSEFADLHKTIITSMQKSSLVREYDIFSSANTGYVVCEHAQGITLEEYVQKNGGRILWDLISEQLKIVLATLDILHEKGIVHRGISPSTLLITEDNRILLTSINISAARTADSQINCEMFPGYSAFEQYDLSERQGAWTDIYGLCASLYFALTGEVPPDAQERKAEDTLTTPSEIESGIPINISEAIMDGMAVNRTERIHNIEELTQILYYDGEFVPENKSEPAGSDGPIVPKVSVKLEPEKDLRPKKRSSVPTKAEIQKKKEKQKKMSNIGALIGIIIFFSLVAALIIAILYFADEAQQAAEAARTAVTTTTPEETEPEKTTTERTTKATTAAPSTTAGEILLLPDFVNRFFNTSLENRYSMLTFVVEYDYSDEYAEGIIYEQDLEPGTQVPSGTVVNIKVSKGAAYTYLPDYIGQKLSDYSNKLLQLGIRYEIEPEETSEVKAGYVVRCSKEIGDKVYISQNESITVYYAVTPKKTEPPETEPPAEQNDEETEEVDENVDGE